MEKMQEKTTDQQAVDTYKQQFRLAQVAHQETRDSSFSWDERENLFRQLYKNAEEKTKSTLSTGELTTQCIDGASRVMAQLPNGNFYNYDGRPGANMAMNFLFEHYVTPNATTGGHLLTKLRMMDLYSRVFPYMTAFVDFKVCGEYAGPDLILVHPRRFYPQPGKTSVYDMDWCFVTSEVSKEWLKEKQKTGYWKNIEQIDIRDDGKGADETERTVTQRGKTSTGYTLIHRFSKDGDYSVMCGDILILDEKKWFPGMPIFEKKQYPLIESFEGLTDFDRGQSAQKAIDTMTRFYLKGAEMSINPPKQFDPEKVHLSSIVNGAGAHWLLKEGGTVVPVNVSPQGLNTYQSTYSILKAILLSLGATTDTSVSTSVDPGLGKTPQALKMQGTRQGSRDAWDAFMMEQFIESAYSFMADLLAQKGMEQMQVRAFDTTLSKIQERFPDEDISSVIHGENGRYSIGQETIKGKYRYAITPGSTTVKKDNGEELLALINMFTTNQPLAQALAQDGGKFNVLEAVKRYLADSGIQDSEKLVTKLEQPESTPGVGDEEATVPMPTDNMPQL